MRDKIFTVYSSQEVLDFTYECAIKCMSIKGDFVECGVAAGSQLAMMKQALVDEGVNKHVYGFDSFEGIPYATMEDDQQPGIGDIDKTKLGLLQSTGISSHSIDNVIENFNKFEVPLDGVSLVKGWFQDTVREKAKEIKSISLLRLDGDLYSSTKECMRYLFSKLSHGGILIIDDYQLNGCKKAVHEFISPKNIIEHLGIAYYIKK